jgi:hypothetical protein
VRFLVLVSHRVGAGTEEPARRRKVPKPAKNLIRMYELLIDIEQIFCENSDEVEVASVPAGLTLSQEDVSTG